MSVSKTQVLQASTCSANVIITYSVAGGWDVEGERRQPPGLWLCEAARANTMTGGPDLSFSFPRNGKIPSPHQATWS